MAAFLVDDGVDRNRRLARFPIADDQLTLSFADRNHGVDDFQTRHQRLVHGTARHDARRHALDRTHLRLAQRPLAVDRLSQRVDHAPR